MTLSYVVYSACAILVFCISTTVSIPAFHVLLSLLLLMLFIRNFLYDFVVIDVVSAHLCCL